MSKISVLVIAFNRPGHVKQAMEPIRAYKPDKLYLACDGPRVNKEGEDRLVADTQKTMLNAVNWICEVKTLFREYNLGCAQAVYEAISWFFKHEEFGIIIEDDVVVGLDFFRLCEQLLPRYKDNDIVMEICAQNRSGRNDINNTYVYTQSFMMWGWATWRRAWLQMSMKMNNASSPSLISLIKALGLFRGTMMGHYFSILKKNIANPHTWDTQWYWSILSHYGLVIVPGVNLAVNIGMECGSHYEEGDNNPYENLIIKKIEWPLVYNDSLEIDPEQKRYDSQDFFNVRMIGLRKKLKRILRIQL